MNKYFLRWFFLPFFFTIFEIGNAASPSTDLVALLNNVHTMQANFVQTSYDNRGKAVQTSYGRMALQRPGKFYWEVTRPIPQLMIANGTRLWIYDRDLAQVTIRSLKNVAGETPALLLSHDNRTIENDFSIQILAKNQPDQHWFSLTPKKPDSMFAKIEMGFKNNQLIDMHLQDHLGHMTGIQFKNAKTNLPLSAKLFVFKTPSHVDVIDETQKH